MGLTTSKKPNLVCIRGNERLLSDILDTSYRPFRFVRRISPQESEADDYLIRLGLGKFQTMLRLRLHFCTGMIARLQQLLLFVFALGADALLPDQLFILVLLLER